MPFEQEIADRIVAYMRKETASFEVACRHEAVPVQHVRGWRRLGLFDGHEAALQFHNAVLRQEADVIAKAEKTLVELATGKRKAGGTRKESRNENTRLAAATWLLERRCPEQYSRTGKAELNRLRQQAADDLLGFLQRTLPDAVYQQVLYVLARPNLALETGEPDE
jgi:hypothetical protein